MNIIVGGNAVVSRLCSFLRAYPPCPRSDAPALGLTGSTLSRPCIAVVQPADLRDGDDAPAAGRLDRTRVRGVAAERPVAA